MDWEAAGVVSGVVIAVGGWTIVMLFSITSKVSALMAQVTSLIDSARCNADDHRRIWERLDDHGERIVRLERNGSSRNK